MFAAFYDNLQHTRDRSYWRATSPWNCLNRIAVVHWKMDACSVTKRRNKKTWQVDAIQAYRFWFRIWLCTFDSQIFCFANIMLKPFDFQYLGSTTQTSDIVNGNAGFALIQELQNRFHFFVSYVLEDDKCWTVVHGGRRKGRQENWAEKIRARRKNQFVRVNLATFANQNNISENVRDEKLFERGEHVVGMGGTLEDENLIHFCEWYGSDKQMFSLLEQHSAVGIGYNGKRNSYWNGVKTLHAAHYCSRHLLLTAGARALR